jgi:hypothetical protein
MGVNVINEMPRNPPRAGMVRYCAERSSPPTRSRHRIRCPIDGFVDSCMTGIVARAAWWHMCSMEQSMQLGRRQGEANNLQIWEHPSENLLAASGNPSIVEVGHHSSTNHGVNGREGVNGRRDG